MKVAQILYSGLGGHASVAYSLQAAAQDAGDGWRGHMVFMGIEPVLPEYERLCRERGLPFDHVRTVAGRAWNAWGELGRALDAAAPDAIVLHSVKAILPAWLHAVRRRIPLIAVEHQPNSLKKPSEWVVSLLLMLLADQVVVLTPDYRDALKKGLGPAWRPGKVTLIPNGIDVSAYAPPADGARSPSGRPLRAGMAARFSYSKRQNLLVDAAALLADDGPDAWRMSLAGDGDTQPALAARVRDEGLEAIVDFPGYLGEGDLRAWFGGLDIYVHASDGETLSTSLLQAMAMGLPILGSDAPGISDLLGRGGGCGVLAKAQSGQGFADALRSLAAEPDRARALGGKARALAVEVFSQEAMYGAYRRIVDAALARRAR